jgi:hypothetical protein
MSLYEHYCEKMECNYGTNALIELLNGRSEQGWELIELQIIRIQTGGTIAVAGQPGPQQVPAWFLLYRRRLDAPPCACGHELPMG